MVDNESVFTDQDMTVANYRAFSPFALFAFCFSVVVSIIALINHSMIFLAVVGVVIAIISIGKLIRGRGKTTGHVFSALALALPLFCISAPLTYDSIELRQLVNQAVAHSDAWLSLVQEGKAHEPFQLMQLRYQRESEGTDLTAVMGGIESPEIAFEYYLRNEPEKSIRADGKDGQFKRIGMVNYEKDLAVRGVKFFYVTYLYTRPNGDQRSFRLDMRRQLYAKNIVVWNVHRVRNIRPNEKREVYSDVNTARLEGD